MEKRKIISIEPNWMFGYGNSPTIKVTVESLDADYEWIYKPIPKDENKPHAQTMLISTNNAPWVRFVYIDNPDGRPQDHGALGGEYLLTDGTTLKSRTGWSSRAGVINTRYRNYIEEEICDVTVYTPDSKVGWAGQNIYADYLANHPLFPKDLHLVRTTTYLKEEVYWQISTQPDKVVKPHTP